MNCAECESFSQLFFPESDLYFWFPIHHSLAKFSSFAPTRVAENHPDGAPVRVGTTTAEIGKFLTSLAGVFTSQELETIKVLCVPSKQTPVLDDFGRVVTLERLISAYQGQWLQQMLMERRYTSAFQPIFDLSSDRIFAHESLFRGHSETNEPFAPAFVFDLAARAGMLFQLDLAARRSAVEQAVAAGITNTRIFINFNPTSIYDPAYCLRTTVGTVTALGMRPDQIVFEVVESSEIKSTAHLNGILAFYRRAGFKIALDDVGSGYSGLNLLQDIRPDFLKVDMHLIRGVDADPFRQSIVRNIVSIARETGIKVIAESVETDAELGWVKQAGIDFVQGYLLARPRSVEECQRAARPAA